MPRFACSVVYSWIILRRHCSYISTSLPPCHAGGTNLIGNQARHESGYISLGWAGSLRIDASLGYLTFPLASHMGGVWEHQIRMVRRVLSSLTREQLLTDESLHMLLTMMEGIVNNRPITSQSDDTRDLELITTSHLLILWPAGHAKRSLQ